MKKFITVLNFPALDVCTPRPYTTYEMVPPPTPEGRACANGRLSALSVCQSRCQNDARMCHAMSFGSRSVMFEDGNNDCNPSLCEERCQVQYRVCFTRCGGKVIPQSG